MPVRLAVYDFVIGVIGDVSFWMNTCQSVRPRYHKHPSNVIPS